VPHAGGQAGVAVTLADYVAYEMGRRNVGGWDCGTHAPRQSRANRWALLPSRICCGQLADETSHHGPTRQSTAQHGTSPEPWTLQHDRTPAATPRHGFPRVSHPVRVDECRGGAAAILLPPHCRQDASPRRSTLASTSAPGPRINPDRAAQSRLVDHPAAPPTDDCKASITGSTPVAASNKTPAPGDFRWCVFAHGTSESAELPTLCRRDGMASRSTRAYRAA
jgi:hypothetical protein